ncbi:glycosyltransferase family 4 protein [Arcanobacterium haemolyticum]|nr:glycosyltransferase family 4 protein [Arcanobacterium haemolyticum]
MLRTLLVTNDFPPRKGGIQTYLEGFVQELDPSNLVVYASSPPDGGAAEYDATHPWLTIRYPGTIMLPIPSVRRRMQDIIREHNIEVVWFGASTPLGIMARAAKAAGAKHVISTTHGHEIGWSMVPGSRSVAKKALRSADTVTYLTRATLRRLRSVIGSTHIVRMPGGINPEQFAFSASNRATLRARYGIGQEPVVVCISRLVKRKGQDTLILAWPEIRGEFPDAKLVIVGKGPYADDLHHLADIVSGSDTGLRDSIIFTGEVPYDELAAHYSLGDIFAMPCRTRDGGLDIEGLGIVYLEAYAAGLPVVAGDSGGAPEAVKVGETGLVAAGHSVAATSASIRYLLAHPEKARAMGEAGRAWVDEQWRWRHLAQPLLDELS